MKIVDQGVCPGCGHPIIITDLSDYGFGFCSDCCCEIKVQPGQKSRSYCKKIIKTVNQIITLLLQLMETGEGQKVWDELDELLGKLVKIRDCYWCVYNMNI